MNHMFLVQISQALQYLHRQKSDDCLWNLANTFEYVGKRTSIHELKCYVHFSLLLKRSIRPEHIIAIAVMQCFKLYQNLLSQLLILLEWNLL